METYDSHKDSGVEWIGEVPAGWEVCRLKHLCEQSKTNANTNRSLRYVGLENIEPWTGRFIESSDNLDKDDSSQTLYCRRGVIFGKLRPYLAKAYRVTTPTICSSEFLVFEHPLIDDRLMLYMLLTESFVAYVNSSAYGTKMPRTNWDSVGKMFLPVPPPLEQQAIADFLDEKTGRIDSLVADTERSVELLEEYRKSVISEAVTKGLDPSAPMKDSGIDWIGEIPSEWQIVRVGRICDEVFDGPFGSNLKSEDYTDSGVRVVRLENLKYMKFDDSKQSFVSEEKYQTIQRHTVYPTDLIFSTFVADEVKVASLPSGVSLAVNKADCVCLRLNRRNSARFVQYGLSSMRLHSRLALETHGSTRARVNTTQIKAIQMPLPSLSEQQEIASYLDAKTAQIDGLLGKQRELIELLREYRKSLVYEAVTGRFKVPGVA